MSLWLEEDTLKYRCVCRPLAEKLISNNNDACTSAIFPFSTKNSLFGEILFNKIKLISLNWNLVSRLIRICIIQWWCSLFCFRPEIPFLGKSVRKIIFVSLIWNLVTSLIRICRIQWCCSLFLFYAGNILFVRIWFKTSKLLV